MPQDTETRINICPGCGKPFRVSYEVSPGGIAVLFAYCGNGRCKASSANDGASGSTSEEAMRKLHKIVSEEMDL